MILAVGMHPCPIGPAFGCRRRAAQTPAKSPAARAAAGQCRQTSVAVEGRELKNYRQIIWT